MRRSSCPIVRPFPHRVLDRCHPSRGFSFLRPLICAALDFFDHLDPQLQREVEPLGMGGDVRTKLRLIPIAKGSWIDQALPRQRLDILTIRIGVSFEFSQCQVVRFQTEQFQFAQLELRPNGDQPGRIVFRVIRYRYRVQVHPKAPSEFGFSPSEALKGREVGTAHNQDVDVRGAAIDAVELRNRETAETMDRGGRVQALVKRPWKR